MASSRLVLPVPLAPVMTVVPSGSGVSWAAAKRRKSTSSKRATLTAGAVRSGDPPRHEQIAEGAVLGAAHGGGARGVVRLEDHLVARHGLEVIDQVGRVDRDVEVLTGVVP